MAQHQGWEQLGTTRPSLLTDTRIELHWAIQMLGAVGRHWIEHLPNYSNEALVWDEGNRALVTRVIPGGNDRLGVNEGVGLGLEELALLRLENGDVRDRFPLETRTIAEGLAWLASDDQGAPALELPGFDIPARAIDKPFPEGGRSERGELARWFSNANRILAPFTALPESGPLLCWPHHFDIATLLVLDSDPEKGRSIGVGLSPGDEAHAEPYWYVTPHPFPGIDLPEPEGGGIWQREPFPGGVLGAERVVAHATASEQEACVQAFLESAVRIGREALTRP